MASRKIIHLDMDYFFAQVEERDNSNLKDKPFSVGSTSVHRGVISTCNYIAREYGVHSAMSVKEALQKCPSLILLPASMEKYKKASSVIRKIFYSLTDQVEPLSLDEAYLDVTHVKKLSNSATWIAAWLKDAIYQATGLTSSVGVAPNKLLAKLASDMNKPNDIDVFIKPMPIKRLHGVGKVTQQKMQTMGIVACEDLQQYDRKVLQQHFGKFGLALYDYCRGQDDRAVTSERVAKSISVENTYQQDFTNIQDCQQAIRDLHKDLLKRCGSNQVISGVFVKITNYRFKKYSMDRKSISYELWDYQLLFEQLYQIHNNPIRLIGIGVRLSQNKVQQLPLFPQACMANAICDNIGIAV